MSENEGLDSWDEGRKPTPEEFAEFMQKFLQNPNSADAMKLAKAAGLSAEPEQLRELLKQLQAAMVASTPAGGASPSGVNWNLASQQAKTIARAANRGVTDQQREQLREAVSIANLWLGPAVAVAELTGEPKLLTRDLWVDDATGLMRALSEPIALRMSTALAEHMQKNAPEELQSILGSAGGLMKQAGGALFAMQIGGAMGKLSTQVISGADLGLPIFSDSRAAFIPQNLDEFVTGLEVEADQVRIYLAVRELAHARLFKQARWLRDHVVSQIVNYASQIEIDDSALQQLAEVGELTDVDEVRELFESQAFLSPKTQDQEAALERIETMLALIEGWVEAVSENATALLPKSAAIAEAVRRRRATGGPAELTFGTLLGLELRPRRLREATAMWRLLTTATSVEKRDALWSHPDLLPSAVEIDDPGLLISRVSGGKSADSANPASGLTDGDEFDRALRDLLGE